MKPAQNESSADCPSYDGQQAASRLNQGLTNPRHQVAMATKNCILVPCLLFTVAGIHNFCIGQCRRHAVLGAGRVVFFPTISHAAGNQQGSLDSCKHSGSYATHVGKCPPRLCISGSTCPSAGLGSAYRALQGRREGGTLGKVACFVFFLRPKLC